MIKFLSLSWAVGVCLWVSPAVVLLFSDRTFIVSVGNFASSSEILSCGVPQGSVLGPLLFALYMFHLEQIMRHFKGVSYLLLFVPHPVLSLR